ncbi:MAG TPA: prepilin peptidase [Candidatus Paceibacterota bacterium]
MALLVFSFFILGSVVGSFLNVVILRHNTGHTLLGRSACLSCGRTLSWSDMVPVLSFLVLRGRCRHCESSISLQYPLVEGATAALFAGVPMLIPVSLTAPVILEILFMLTVLSLLIIIGVYDIRHTIIPDIPATLLILLSLGQLFFSSGEFMIPMLPALLAGPAAALPLAFLWLVSRGKWMGFGDAKLALGLGWFLGLSGALSMLIFSFWIGAFVSVLLMLFARVVHDAQLFGGVRRLTMKSEVAFGPFLITAFLLVLFFGLDITMLLTR